MPKEDPQEERIDNMSAGGHVGGTHFGGQQDAKTKVTKKDGDKPRPNRGAKEKDES